MFSSRTNWQRYPNRLAQALEAHAKSGKTIHDLTATNPTDGGFLYPEREIQEALCDPRALIYQPDPRGLVSAREAVARYYHEKLVSVDPGCLFLTASTSEAYSLIFKLLCNAGESVLVPQPSYPLFEYLAQVNDVSLQYYSLMYNHGWHIDAEALARAITPSTRAIAIVNPHNPTGMFLKKSEFAAIRELALRHDLALIVDEVFIDYPFQDDRHRFGSTAGASDILTFTLNGISKTIGLPQMKLGWIAVSGNEVSRIEAVERLEILNDAFLSLNSPVQIALPQLFKHCVSVRHQIRDRISSNYQLLTNILSNTSFSGLLTEGGWCSILSVPKTKSDEDWALTLLRETGVLVQPGYFFDFVNEGFLVVSLLTKQQVFERGVRLMIDFVGQ